MEVDTEMGPMTLEEEFADPLVPARVVYSAEEQKLVDRALIVPFGIRVVIELDEVPGESKGGIVVPEHSRSQTREFALTGTVLAVGPNIADTIRPGDRVLFGEYCFKKLWTITGFPKNKQITLTADQIMGLVKFDKIEIGEDYGTNS